MIIRDRITKQEKEILTEMLYNREVVLTWDFMEMEKVKKEVTSLQKIRTIEYKDWQIPGF